MYIERQLEKKFIAVSEEYPLSCGNLPGLEVCDENRHGTAECCHEGG